MSAHLVWSIMFLPKEVVEEEISRQGILPMVAPVNPYTLLALTCAQVRASSASSSSASSISCTHTILEL